MEQFLKKCSKCGEEKALSEFFKDKHNENGLTCKCKQCYKNYNINNKDKRQKYLKEWEEQNKELLSKKDREYYIKNKERIKQYSIDNKEKIKKRMNQWILDNKETLKIKRKQYYTENREIILARDKQYAELHKEQKKKYNRDYQKKNKDKIRIKANETRRLRLKTDINYKVAEYLRTRTRAALNKNYKSSHTLEMLGCSIEELKNHLESQFTEGMSWDNYGLRGWHIDHIKPCCSFDLSKPEEQQKCFRYTNLQPLWWYDNLDKRLTDNKKYR
jgi:hypothetical protein